MPAETNSGRACSRAANAVTASAAPTNMSTRSVSSGDCIGEADQTEDAPLQIARPTSPPTNIRSAELSFPYRPRGAAFLPSSRRGSAVSAAGHGRKAAETHARSATAGRDIGWPLAERIPATKLASAVRAVATRRPNRRVSGLVVEPPEYNVYDLANQPQNTWRQVFDWHADAIGRLHIAGLDAETSSRYTERLRRSASRSLWSRLFDETANSLKSLPRSAGTAVPTAKEVVVNVLEAARAARIDRKIGGDVGAPARPGSVV